MSIEIGQVLALRLRFNNSGTISAKKHPYLIIDIDAENHAVEIAQFDSLTGKEFKAAFRSNFTVLHTNPVESVIDGDSYIQMDNMIKVEFFEGLEKYRRQTTKLSTAKLENALTAYRKYHEEYAIDENKQVFIDREELEVLNT
jgi:hypothetical protein